MLEAMFSGRFAIEKDDDGPHAAGEPRNLQAREFGVIHPRVFGLFKCGVCRLETKMVSSKGMRIIGPARTHFVPCHPGGGGAWDTTDVKWEIWVVSWCHQSGGKRRPCMIGEFPPTPPCASASFIDRDPTYFPLVLSYLRDARQDCKPKRLAPGRPSDPGAEPREASQIVCDWVHMERRSRKPAALVRLVAGCEPSTMNNQIPDPDDDHPRTEGLNSHCA